MKLSNTDCQQSLTKILNTIRLFSILPTKHNKCPIAFATKNLKMLTVLNVLNKSRKRNVWKGFMEILNNPEYLGTWKVSPEILENVLNVFC